MKRIVIFVFIAAFCFAPAKLYSQNIQEKLILLHGAVLDAASQQTLVNVHYLVNGSSEGVTGTEGKFSMFLSRHDTIMFSYLGYSDFEMVLSDTLIGSSFVAAIFMESDTLSIGEVIVIPRLGDLRSEFRSMKSPVSQELVNAQNNIQAATHQGLTSSSKLGDPSTNFELLRRKQVVRASEMGGIPSDKMIGLNVFTIIPAAIYLMSNGLPKKPVAPAPQISPKEMEKMIELYKKKYKR